MADALTGADPVKMLGIQIANGYSAEARVFASLLGHRADAFEALVLHHEWTGDRGSAEAFANEARVRLARFDTGWRPNPDGRRSPPAKLGSWVRFRATLPRMVATAAAYKPDAVVSSQQKWDCAAATRIAQRLDRPQIIHLHYLIGPWLGGAVLKRLLTCAHVIAISDFIRDDALRHGVPPERVTTIRNTVLPPPTPSPATREEVRTEIGVPPDVPLLGIAARLDPFKGQLDTIAAFARVVSLFPDAWLTVIGGTLSRGGSSRAGLEAYAAAAGVTDRVLFLGQRADVPRLLQGLDVFVHPSRREPFGLAVAEASAAGLPVVAYDEGAIPEIVVHGETGLLATAGDVEALATHLETLLRQPDVGRNMGRAGRERIERNFRPDGAAAAFSGMLTDLGCRGLQGHDRGAAHGEVRPAHGSRNS